MSETHSRDDRTHHTRNNQPARNSQPIRNSRQPVRNNRLGHTQSIRPARVRETDGCDHGGRQGGDHGGRQTDAGTEVR
ncbi:hypothetical protein SAMN06269185_2843 [Natronoarchaeum philippinense]|uniref:Uncharacterized protein n=1 Tax=Natronoarchaeum philippinense TaxID=558529 RepID=A0A285P6C3_NATPI|nr:hypothetical protein SAMN06269185_2843 [Natronoarchaeum philippinense]